MRPPLRTFFLLAVSFLGLACAADLAAKSTYARVAVRIAVMSRPNDTIASCYLAVARTFTMASYGLALLGAISWAASAARREPARHAVPLVLLIAFLLLQLMVV